MNAITILGHNVINEAFDDFFNNFPTHLKASTQGYPVADIYRDDDGSTVLEFALAGFKKKELAIDIQPDRRAITITGKANEENSKRQRIARRNFTRTYVNYDDNLDLSQAKAYFENGLLSVRVPPRHEAKPVSIQIN
jgi:HSP20 family molecular chaperone IbpA